MHILFLHISRKCAYQSKLSSVLKKIVNSVPIASLNLHLEISSASVSSDSIGAIEMLYYY